MTLTIVYEEHYGYVLGYTHRK